MNKKTNLAIIGCGIITQNAHIPALLRLQEELQVIAVCNRSREKAMKAAQLLQLQDSAVWTDWELMLQKTPGIDAVLIALPIPLNYAVSKACCKAGLSVLCEKPAAIIASEAKETTTFSETYKVTYMTAENYQYEPKFKKTAELLAAGTIGQLHSIQWNFLSYMAVDNTYNKTFWRANNVYPGGYVMDGGVHAVHALQMLAGPIKTVYAHTASIEKALGTMDLAFSLLTHNSGVISSLNMGWRSAESAPNLKLYGTEGSLIVKDDCIDHITATGEHFGHTWEHENSFYLMWKDFLHTVQTGEPAKIPKNAPAHDVEVILGIIESGKAKKPINIS